MGNALWDFWFSTNNSRTSEIIPLFKNGLAFAAAAIAGYLLSQTVFSRYEKTKKS